MALQMDRPVSKPQLCHLLAVWPWAAYLASLNMFLYCHLGITGLTFLLRNGLELFVQNLAYSSRYSVNISSFNFLHSHLLSNYYEMDVKSFIKDTEVTGSVRISSRLPCTQ